MNRTKPRLVKRRSVRQRQRDYRAMQQLLAEAGDAARRASFLLCAVLAQAGGTVTLTQGTLDQCVEQTDRLGFKMAETVQGKEYVVTLLFRDDQPDVATTIPAVVPIVITG